MTAPEMRVLTVRQPWAWAIMAGGKDVENRVRNLAGDYRGPIAIHVAGKYAVDIDSDILDFAMTDWFEDNPDVRQWPWQSNVGKIIGVVDLVGVHHSGDSRFDGEGTRFERLCSPWAEQDCYHLELANPRPLTVPVEWKGALGLRRLPAETVELILGLQYA